MRSLIALAISAAALVAVLMWVSVAAPSLGLIPWVSLISAGAYFTAGGGKDGILKPLWAGLLGVVLTALALYVIGRLGGSLGILVVGVALLAFFIVMSSGVALFAYVPATFMAASAFVGAGGKADMTVVFVGVSWAIGLLLAWAIDNLSRVLNGRLANAGSSAS